MAGTVLILGSGPEAPRAAHWNLGGFSEVVAINNAWRAGPGWTVSIFPDDFPADRRPPWQGAGQRIVLSHDYVASQNRFGGVVYAGGTMAYTASYWALDMLRPETIAYLGCDMVYPEAGRTHFYGNGAADPLRRDPTLQSLEAKARRFQAVAALRGCAVVNLSTSESRLPYPRASVETLAFGRPAAEAPDRGAVEDALAEEASAGQFVASGRYWDAGSDLDADALARIDALWIDAYAPARASRVGALS